RYATAAALAEELHRFLEHRPILARPVGVVGRGWRWCRRNRLAASLLLLVVVLLLAGIGTGTYSVALAKGQAGLEEAGDDAEAARRLAETQSERADGQARQTQQQKELVDRLRYSHQVPLALREWENGNTTRARALLHTTQEDLRGWEYAYLDTL